MTEDQQALPGNDIPLAQMLQTLRTELQRSMIGARTEPLKLRVEKVELELQIAVTQEGSAGAGIRFWVLSAEARGGSKYQNTHTFKLTLQPTTAEGTQALVGDTEDAPPR